MPPSVPAPLAEPALRARGVGVRIGRATLLRDVSLGVAPGELVALVGPNGAGKSTLLRAIAGLLACDGTVALGGRPVGEWTARERARRIALVRQATALDASFTVRELVELGRAPHVGWLAALRAADHAAVDEALGAMGLEALAARDVSTLSGGEQQRALLAQALAQDPGVLLLDEPTAHLDVRHELDLLLRIAAERDRGRAVVLAVHDLERAARFADRLVVLDHGRVVAEGAPPEVLTPSLLRDVFGVEAEVEAGRDGLTLRYLRPVSR